MRYGACGLHATLTGYGHWCGSGCGSTSRSNIVNGFCCSILGIRFSRCRTSVFVSENLQEAQLQQRDQRGSYAFRCSLLKLLKLFTARCYAERGIAKASCPSVRLWRWGIVYIYWNSWKIISRLMGLTYSLSADPNITDLLQSKGNTPNFSRNRSRVGKIVYFRHLSMWLMHLLTYLLTQLVLCV